MVRAEHQLVLEFRNSPDPLDASGGASPMIKERSPSTASLLNPA
jgi:hypothetical protein